MDIIQIIKLAFEGINFWFTIAIFILMVIDIVTFYEKEGARHRHMTGLMTGLGILGTFLGIVIGLIDFDTLQIQASIPKLLEGMKTAFVTSVFGLAAAIITEFIERLIPSKMAKVGDPLAETIHRHMEGLSELISGTLNTNKEVALNVAALRTETKDEMSKSRTFFQKEFGGMRESLDDAIGKLAKGATEEIIKSLEEVIKNFNDNLVEQFGENFKQLNAACLKLVEWQKEFKGAVESATTAINMARESLGESAEQFALTLERKIEFQDVIKDTGLSIKALAALNDRLEKIAGQETIVLQKFEQVVKEFGNTASETKSDVDRALESVKDHFNTVLGNTDVLSGKFDTMLKTSKETYDATNQKMNETLANHAKSHEQIAESVKQVIDRLEKGGSHLDANLANSLRKLEESLTSLTTDFGVAYQGYLDGLRKLTNLPGV
jgi:biopolymer transport protein ExbB/TolQ